MINKNMFLQQKMLIVGRTGSGKDTYAKYLEKLYLKGVCSYTTRPRRPGEGDTHIFIEKEEVENFPNKVAYTEINGYEYFSTKEQLDKSDFYIIDPEGINYLNQNFPDVNYKIIYIYASYDIRKERAISRVPIEDRFKEEYIFNQRNSSENAQFDLFEKLILSEKNVIIHNNDQNDKCFLQEMAFSDINDYYYFTDKYSSLFKNYISRSLAWLNSIKH